MDPGRCVFLWWWESKCERWWSTVMVGVKSSFSVFVFVTHADNWWINQSMDQWMDQQMGQVLQQMDGFDRIMPAKEKSTTSTIEKKELFSETILSVRQREEEEKGKRQKANRQNKNGKGCASLSCFSFLCFGYRRFLFDVRPCWSLSLLLSFFPSILILLCCCCCCFFSTVRV